MPTKKQKQINLIPQDQFESSGFGRVLKWILSSFRIIVIVTELVVMSAFLSRFWLDARNSDLNDEIDVGSSQVLAYQEIEKEFRSIQKRLATAKSVYSEARVTSYFNEVSNKMPSEISLISVSNNENQISIKASTTSEEKIAEFLVNLEESKNLVNIKLSQVTSNIDNSALTNFTITADLQKNIERTVQ